jgi:hypothetical protein
MSIVLILTMALRNNRSRRVGGVARSWPSMEDKIKHKPRTPDTSLRTGKTADVISEALRDLVQIFLALSVLLFERETAWLVCCGQSHEQA